ncbi:MAG: hypothetical protein ACFCVK_07600 [Acidimicrobiales bacterium]
MTDRDPQREPSTEPPLAGDAAPTTGRPPADDQRRARVLRLLLVIVGAGLAAAALSLYEAGSTDDPVDAALTEAANATSGVVSIDIDVPTADATGRIHLETEYSGDDYLATFRATSDAVAHAGSDTTIQQVRSVDGSSFVRPIGADGFIPGDADGLDLTEGVPAGTVVTPALLGWRGAGIEALADDTEFEPVIGGRHRATVTVGDLRRLDPGIAALALITDDASPFGDADPVELTVDIADGVALSLVARASGTAGPDDLDAGPTMTVTVTFADLGGDHPIDVPAGAGP